MEIHIPVDSMSVTLEKRFKCVDIIKNKFSLNKYYAL